MSSYSAFQFIRRCLAQSHAVFQELNGTFQCNFSETPNLVVGRPLQQSFQVSETVFFFQQPAIFLSCEKIDS